VPPCGCAGIVAQALAAPASGVSDVMVAVGGVLLAACAVLLTRVLRYLTRPQPRARDASPRPPGK